MQLINSCNYFARYSVLLNSDVKHQYRNKGDQPFKMIYGVPKEFE